MNAEKQKILLLNANPVPSSFSYACSNAYHSAVEQAGAEVMRFNIEEMDFDPVLHKGYEEIQELEPDLLKFQQAIRLADHLVFVYPNWWNTMPAKMKGLFDRAFLPKFAFSFEGGMFNPLLKGKSGRIINIVGSAHPFLLWCSIGSYTNELSKGILCACGVKPVATTSFGPTRGSSDEMRQKWIDKVRMMAIKDARK